MSGQAGVGGASASDARVYWTRAWPAFGASPSHPVFELAMALPVYVLVPTSRRPRLIHRMLASLAACRLPGGYQEAVVVPCGVEYEVEPPAWLRPHLPAAALGYELPRSSRDSWYLGFNGAAYATELPQLGGFDPLYGLVSSAGGGQETDAQERLRQAGRVGIDAPRHAWYLPCRSGSIQKSMGCPLSGGGELGILQRPRRTPAQLFKPFGVAGDVAGDGLRPGCREATPSQRPFSKGLVRGRGDEEHQHMWLDGRATA